MIRNDIEGAPISGMNRECYYRYIFKNFKQHCKQLQVNVFVYVNKFLKQYKTQKLTQESI